MQTTIRPTFFNTAAMYSDKLNYTAFAAWLFTAMVVLFGIRYARESIAALLLKLYELIIQKNAVNI
jgi:hypothetical protein